MPQNGARQLLNKGQGYELRPTLRLAETQDNQIDKTMQMRSTGALKTGSSFTPFTHSSLLLVIFCLRKALLVDAWARALGRR